MSLKYFHRYFKNFKSTKNRKLTKEDNIKMIHRYIIELLKKYRNPQVAKIIQKYDTTVLSLVVKFINEKVYEKYLPVFRR